MASKVQLTGGLFQDAIGNPLANGYLIFELSQDAQVNSTTQIAAGSEIKITLNNSGSVDTTTAQDIWPNDVLSPASLFYTVSGYTEDGQLVWGPNSQQVFSTPSPYDIGVWIPGSVNTLPPTNLAASNVTLASTATTGAATLPANPVAFLPININGTNYKIALYST